MSADPTITQGNLPAEPNTFIGRERDRAELAQLLTVARVVTLCGVGGIGKTRLALRLASDVEPRFPDGAWLVALSDITHPGLVGPRIAGALGLRAEPRRPTEATLADALRTRNLLLILDSCEHLVTECAELCERLLALCPWLRVVATSREPLRVPGETVWRVPPLSLPSPDNGLLVPGEQPGELARTEAVRLFTERAAAARPGFALSLGNAAAVTRVCRTLDGMPLAIELAAARVGALAVEQISDRLADRFHLLGAGTRTAPPRQRTLRATVDWSYELLTGPEQLLLRRLAVFSGWNLEAAERVCADDELPAEAVLDLLAALIDKSLVALAGEEAGDARYRLLDTIRQYAAERLEASGELPSLRRRHRDYLLDFAESTSVRGFRRGGATWPVRLALYRRAGMELGNFRDALAWSLDQGDIGYGLRLCTALRTPWVGHGDVAEGIPWFDRFLDSIPGDIPRDYSRGVAGDVPAGGGRDARAGAGGVDPVVLGRALACRAELAFEHQDYETARRCARDGLAACRADGDEFTVPVTLRVLAQSELRAGRLEVGRELIAEAITAAEATGNDWEHGIGLATQAAMAARQGRLREAQRTYQAALDVLRDNTRWGVAHTLYGMGTLALARGDLEAAAAHFAEALVTFREMDARPWSARCLGGLGRIATERGDYGAAREQLTESLRLSRATGQRLAMARGLEAFALLAAAQQQLERAVRLAGAALELRAAIGPAPAAGARLDDLLEPARKTLGAPAAAALLAEGRAMTPDGAVRYATEAPGPGAAPAAAPSAPRAAAGAAAAPPGGTGAQQPGSECAEIGSSEASGGISGDGWARFVADGPAGAADDEAEVTPGPAAGTAAAPSSLLTPREWEIARLIARGLTNRGIADELVISPATAARHVANILAKLGFSSRAQVAVWASAREPAGPR
jgi:predicted ATPase/DNA-binding CsgD family transcriptional regulator